MQEGSPVQIRLGAAIRRLRTEAGVTQEELSRRTDLHPTYISDIERGVRNPSFVTLVRLSSGLGVSLAELGAAFDQTA